MLVKAYKVFHIVSSLRLLTIKFDTPPAMTVTDAVVLSNIVNGVIYVIKSGEVTKEVVKRSILQLSGKKSEMLGVVMNSVDVSRGGYYHYHSRYYNYGYVYGSEEDSKKNKKKKMVKTEERGRECMIFAHIKKNHVSRF